MSEPEDWQTCELFDFLQVNHCIHPDEVFEEWMHDRYDMIKMVKKEIEDNLREEIENE